MNYKERSSCSYFDHSGRYGLDLIPDSVNDGLTLELEGGEIIPFTARIKYTAYSCVFDALGIYLIYNDLEGTVFYKKSDAIYFINVYDDDSNKSTIEYLRPGRFDILLKSRDKETAKGGLVTEYMKREYDEAIQIYDEHIHMPIPIR